MNLIHRFTLLGIVLFSVLVTFESSARAQTLAKGSFALPYAVKWQGSVLPEGDYTFRVEEHVPRDVVYIRGSGALKNVQAIVVAGRCSEGERGKSVLYIREDHGVHQVESLGIADLGRQYSYGEDPKQQDVLGLAELAVYARK